MSSMISRDVLAPLRLLLGQLAEDLRTARCRPAGGDAEGVADLVADPAGDLVLEPRGGLEPLDQRAPFQVGQDAVQLVGDLLELGQQVLLLARRPPPSSPRRGSGGSPRSLLLPRPASSPAACRGVLSPLLAGAACRRAPSRAASATTPCRRPAGRPARASAPSLLRLGRLARLARGPDLAGHLGRLAPARSRPRSAPGRPASAGRRPTASGCPRCP